MSEATTPRTKMTPTSLLTELQSIVGAEHTRAPEESSSPRPYPPPFAIDGITPRVIISPGTYEEVAAVIKYANANRLAIIPFGRGLSYGGMGNLPRRYDIALSTIRLNRIVEYEPADLTVTCQAGTGVGDLSQTLRESGQMMPFGHAILGSTLPGGPSVGKLLATNEFGNVLYGSPRDFTTGMRVVTGDGSITRSGGKVVKNVAGYDLSKLFIGSHGTLGIIVEASLKLAPVNQTSEELRLESESLDEACRFATGLRRRGVSLWGIRIHRPTFRRGTDEAHERIPILTVEIAGTHAAVNRSLLEIERLSKDGGTRPASPDHERPDEIDDWIARDPSHGELLSCEISVLPSLVPKLVRAIDETAPDAWISVQPISGLFSATLRTPNAEAIVTSMREAAARLGGSLIVTGCDPALKRQIDVFGEVPPETLDLMRRIKHQFDPNGILSPGRFVGKL
jgi:glycolate oxidase FAD binding subunit